MEQPELVRLSELTGKNMVNIYDGVRLGVLYEPAFSFDPETGCIEQLYLGGRNGFTGNWSEKHSLPIPWHAVRKIGQEVILVELGQSPARARRQQR